MPLTFAALSALSMSATGSLLATGSTIADGPATGSNLPALIQGGGSAAAVAGLIYVARLIIKGDLVSRPVRDSEAEMGAALRATAERERRLQELLAESLAAQQTMHRINGETTRVNAELVTEMRIYREERKKRKEDL